MLPPAWKKRLVDINIQKLTDNDLAWADYVFISGMIVQRDSAHQIIAQCKEANLKVVAGGPLFTHEFEHFKDVDFFVLNEAELTLPPFLADLERGCTSHIYTNMDFPDIRQSPIPLWEIVNFKRYATMCIQFSRGCPYYCEFCNVTALYGHHPRIKTSGQVIAELDYLCSFGWRGPIFFVDDNFIGNKKYLKSNLLPALIEWQKKKIGVTFYTEATINLADDEQLMQMMVDAGFDMVFIGIETPNKDSLLECNKKLNRNRNMVEDVKCIQRAGLQVQGGFIVGFDSDTPSIFQRQIDFIQKSGIVTAMVGLLQAPFGTKLYERLKKENRILSRMTGDNVDGTTNIIPMMNLETLREGYREILQHIYSPKHYYKRIKTFLREYKAPAIKAPLKWSHIMAFLRSIFYLGFKSKERFYYWNLLFWTQFRRRELFPLAITLAIYGYHFRKVCDLHIS